jgi:hypothetical protein
MCCFSGPVQSVTGTNIFARNAGNGRQHLVYAMTLSADQDLAMILPLPVPKGTAENAITWVDLSGYPDFFDALYTEFAPVSKGGSRSRGGDDSLSLDVVKVGSFEASFVPTVADFSRLDARFRMPAGVWDQLPAYQDHGFAVFKLAKGEQKVHPMAFTFPRAGDALFFPTVHVHDGQVHPTAKFDHSLYLQTSNRERQSGMLTAWRESVRPAGQIVDAAKAKGLVDPAEHVFYRPMRGDMQNADVRV